MYDAFDAALQHSWAERNDGKRLTRLRRSYYSAETRDTQPETGTILDKPGRLGTPHNSDTFKLRPDHKVCDSTRSAAEFLRCSYPLCFLENTELVQLLTEAASSSAEQQRTDQNSIMDMASQRNQHEPENRGVLPQMASIWLICRTAQITNPTTALQL
ncbi:hypothetical protein GBF38_018132 [Nibea albiflora]|uniref:Uncharacterized protein n=1 Tax=Nibea albiflora TaxID=240163 RepID=A0ACB7EJ38_NIBAL|nr:hypothetical protein GBF38_018132 [Nibea albiflora]